ncbi:MAG: retropepsin-like aspartic protease [Chloroherpetonaceae bacterium]
MYKILYFILFLFLVGCGSTSVYINQYNEPLSPDTTSYSNYWTTLRTGMPEYSNRFNISKDWEAFATGLKFIKENNISDAETIFFDLSKSTNDTISTNSKYILGYLLVDKSKWKDYYNFFKNDSEPDSIAIKRLLYPAFMYSPAEKITYTNDEANIPLKIKGGLPIIKVIMNGEVYSFLFDTGAQITTISNNVAKKNGIMPLYYHPRALVGSQGLNADIQTAIIDDLEIGNLHILNHPCFITDESNLKFRFLFITLLKLDGIIGWNAIKNMDVTLDYKNDNLILRKPQKKQHNDQNIFWLEEPIIKLKSKEGINLLFFVDTGAKYSSFYDLLLQKISIPKIEEKQQRMWGVGGSKKEKVKVIPEVSFILNNYELQFKNFKSDGQNNNFILLDGAIGSDIGQKGKIHIDALNGYFGIEY